MNEAEAQVRIEALEAMVAVILERLDKPPTLEEQHQAWVARLKGETG